MSEAWRAIAPLVRLSFLALLIALPACPRSTMPVRPATAGPLAPGAESASALHLRGHVDFGEPLRATRATVGEIGTGATVSLIDTSTGYTIATTLSSLQGSFNLSPPGGWLPTAGVVYYLEAIKGLSAGTTFPNRVSASAARVRTLVTFQGGWQSISPGGIVINPTTTALCIVLSLRSMTPSSAGRQISPSSLVGVGGAGGATATTPATYAYSDTGLMPPSLVNAAYLAVKQALEADRDPFEVISLDLSDPQYDRLQYATSGMTVAAVLPNTQTIGSQVQVVGTGFAKLNTGNVVAFAAAAGATVSAPVTSVSADGNRMTVTVPGGTVAGPVSVTTAGITMFGPTFYPQLSTGHIAADANGNLYVANQAFGTIAAISPAGEVSTFAAGLNYPRHLTIFNGTMYIACAGTQKGVVALDMANPAAAPVNYGTQGVIRDPRGLAFAASGRLWVSDGAGNALWHIDATDSVPAALAATGTTLSNPHGITFGTDGKLYVANYGANTVLQVNTATGAATSYMEGLASPWAVTFDALGNLYVSNNSGNSVYRRLVSGSVTAFAAVPNAGGLVADRSGYLYTIDNSANNVYRITSVGDASLFASGFSSPSGVVKVGSTLYVLSQTNNSLVQVDTTTGKLTTLARGLNQPFGLAYDSVRDVFYVSNVGNGKIVSVSRSTGATNTVLTGTGTTYGGASGIAYANGRLYVRSNQHVVSYDVTSFGAGPLTYRSIMEDNKGLAGDTSGGANNGSYYIAASGNRILRVVGDGCVGGSCGASNYAIDFANSIGDPNLNNPLDVTVDNGGHVWVVNNGNAKLTTYNSDGTTYLAPIALGANPKGINRDSANVAWVAAYDPMTITGYDMSANGAVIRAINTSPYHPINVAIQPGTTNMVASALEGVLKITTYGTSPSVSLVNSNLKDGRDIDVDSNGQVFVTPSSSYHSWRLDPTYTTSLIFYWGASATQYLWQVPGGGNFYFSDTNFFNSSTGGCCGVRLGGVYNNFSGPTLAGIDANGVLYLNSSYGSGSDIVNRIRPGLHQQEWTYSIGSPCCYTPGTGAFAADPSGNMYLSSYYGMQVKWIDPDGNITDTIPGRTADYVTKGSFYDPGTSLLYQTVQSYHRVETLDPVSKIRTVLPYGLSAADM